MYSASKLHFQLQLPRLLPVGTRAPHLFPLSFSFSLALLLTSIRNSLVSFRLFSRIYFTYASERTHVDVSPCIEILSRLRPPSARARRTSPPFPPPSIDNSRLESLIDSSIRKSQVMGTLNLVLNQNSWQSREYTMRTANLDKQYVGLLLHLENRFSVFYAKKESIASNLLIKTFGSFELAFFFPQFFLIASRLA